jgi:hypothetical protein
MQLKLKELQTIVKSTIKEEKSLSKLREEMFRVLGPAVNVPGEHKRLAALFNEQLDLLESTSRFPRREEFRLSVLLEVADSKIPDVRRLVARLLPERYMPRFLQDPNSSVRCAAARRSSYGLVKESLRKNPKDELLRSIAAQKRLDESGLPTPKPVTEPFDMYGDEPLGDVVKSPSEEKLSDEWYYRTAHKLCAEYGTNLEGQWEEVLATRVAASYMATSHVSIDREKLLQAIYDCIKEREDAVLGEGSLKMLVRRLRNTAHFSDAVMPVLKENVFDPVADLVESRCSAYDYIEKAETVFGIKKSYVPAGIKKHRLGEASTRETAVPVLGRLPTGFRLDSQVETALDKYVAAWNTHQRMTGEPYKLSWSPHPAEVNMIGFNLELK